MGPLNGEHLNGGGNNNYNLKMMRGMTTTLQMTLLSQHLPPKATKKGRLCSGRGPNRASDFRRNNPKTVTDFCKISHEYNNTIVDGLGGYSVMERGDDISISRARDSNRYEYERKG